RRGHRCAGRGAGGDHRHGALPHGVGIVRLRDRAHRAQLGGGDHRDGWRAVRASVIVQIAAAMTNADWLWKTYEYLPSTAGSAITGFGMGGASSLEPWAGFAVFCGYTVVA